MDAPDTEVVAGKAPQEFSYVANIWERITVDRTEVVNHMRDLFKRVDLSHDNVTQLFLFQLHARESLAHQLDSFVPFGETCEELAKNIGDTFGFAPNWIQVVHYNKQGMPFHKDSNPYSDYPIAEKWTLEPTVATLSLDPCERVVCLRTADLENQIKVSIEQNGAYAIHGDSFSSYQHAVFAPLTSKSFPQHLKAKEHFSPLMQDSVNGKTVANVPHMALNFRQLRFE